jgi:hypothetical protein
MYAGREPGNCEFPAPSYCLREFTPIDQYVETAKRQSDNQPKDHKDDPPFRFEWRAGANTRLSRYEAQRSTRKPAHSTVHENLDEAT